MWISRLNWKFYRSEYDIFRPSLIYLSRLTSDYHSEIIHSCSYQLGTDIDLLVDHTIHHNNLNGAIHFKRHSLWACQIRNKTRQELRKVHGTWLSSLSMKNIYLTITLWVSVYDHRRDSEVKSNLMIKMLRISLSFRKLLSAISDLAWSYYSHTLCGICWGEKLTWSSSNRSLGESCDGHHLR